MTNATETSRPYYSPVFFQDGEHYNVLDILTGEDGGVADAIDHAAQWDYGNDNPDNYRDTISGFDHEWEYGPHDGYWLVVSRSAGYSYLIRASGDGLGAMAE